MWSGLNPLGGTPAGIRSPESWFPTFLVFWLVSLLLTNKSAADQVFAVKSERHPTCGVTQNHEKVFLGSFSSVHFDKFTKLMRLSRVFMCVHELNALLGWNINFKPCLCRLIRSMPICVSWSSISTSCQLLLQSERFIHLEHAHLGDKTVFCHCFNGNFYIFEPLGARDNMQRAGSNDI